MVVVAGGVVGLGLAVGGLVGQDTHGQAQLLAFGNAFFHIDEELAVPAGQVRTAVRLNLVACLVGFCFAAGHELGAVVTGILGVFDDVGEALELSVNDLLASGLVIGGNL